MTNVAKFEFIAVTHYLKDVLEVMNILCLSLQASNMTYDDVMSLTEITQTNLQALKQKPGASVTEFFNV